VSGPFARGISCRVGRGLWICGGHSEGLRALLLESVENREPILETDGESGKEFGRV